jgi:hypothetical protein
MLEGPVKKLMLEFGSLKYFRFIFLTRAYQELTILVYSGGALYIIIRLKFTRSLRFNITVFDVSIRFGLIHQCGTVAFLFITEIEKWY